jgi:NlpC/P60 family putative phage cell wall peptidase
MDDCKRAEIVAEARTWLRTPYHHLARVKGAGVDCVQLIIAVYAKCGVIEDFEPEFYRPDWHLHRSEEKYLAGVKQRAHQITVEEALPGDFALFRFGHCASHGAIVTEWPRVIHALMGIGVIETSVYEAEVRGRLDSVWRLE